MNKYLGILISAILVTAVIADVALNRNKRLFDEEVAYYTELANSEPWCFLVQQPENHTWEFHKEYYDIVISKWERVGRKELRAKIMEGHALKCEYSGGIIFIRIIEADMVIFFFHPIPDSPDVGVIYWKSGL